MLFSCATCGILTCVECGGDRSCLACRAERRRAEQRERRMNGVVVGLRALGVFACASACGLAAAGALLLPDEQLLGASNAHLMRVAYSEMQFVADAVGQYFDAHGGRCPVSLGEVRRDGLLFAAPIDPWGEALVFGCVDGPQAFVVLSKGPDREAGTADDLMFASP